MALYGLTLFPLLNFIAAHKKLTNITFSYSLKEQVH